MDYMPSSFRIASTQGSDKGTHKGQYRSNKPPPTPQGTHKGCPYNGTDRSPKRDRTIVGASLVGALGEGGILWGQLRFLNARSMSIHIHGMTTQKAYQGDTAFLC